MACALSFAAPPTAAQTEFFEKKVRPVLSTHCYKCHATTSEKLKGELKLDSREDMLKGGETGPSIVPGKPEKSLLIKSVRQTDKELQMPPKGKLSEQEVADLAEWVKMGAPWPGSAKTASSGAGDQWSESDKARYEKLRKEHWAFQPVKTVPTAVTPNSEWARTEVDHYVLAKLNQAGLSPSPMADKRTLIRRASLDLIGLPPTPAEIDAFIQDSSPNAFEKVIDRLLASPAFGERWGRHWLDVVRYAESTGMTRNAPFYYAWRYRDYVIDSFNEDKPYNQFVMEQVAGDLMLSQNPAQKDERTIATGFLVLGPKDLNERNPQQFLMNNVDEMIDTTTRAFLAMTVACARCHDHKFDPVPQEEYYSLAGIFRSTEMLAGVASRRGPFRDLYDPDMLAPLNGYVPQPAEKKYDEKKITAELRKNGLSKEQIKRRLKEEAKRRVQQGGEKEIRPVAMGVADADDASDCNVLIRGELNNRGPVVKRGVIDLPGVPKANSIGADRSGRMELAQWLVHERNPLTARVMVNRIWQHLFGQGIVITPDNFGTSGESPSHPQLLDYLAQQFMKNGWSVKKSIRSIMLSSVYQQSSNFDSIKASVDPQNVLLWRMSQRRLEGEAIRDSILAVSGTLDPVRPTGSVVMKSPPVDIGRRGQLDNLGENQFSRSVYLPILRNEVVPDFLEVFDFADPSLVTGQRDVTTVPPQALYMMNDPFVIRQSRKLAERVAGDKTLSDSAKISAAYDLVLGRPPTPAETQRGIEYVKSFPTLPKNSEGVGPWTTFCQALLASAEFRYVN